MQFIYSRIKFLAVLYFYHCTAQKNSTDPKCHIKGKRFGCPLGSNLSQVECEAYNCCYDNTSSPRCYKKDPVCQRLACEMDNAKGNLQCPDPFKIEIARVKNIAEETCNGVEKCETIIQKPKNTRKRCNGRTKCILKIMIYEGEKYETCPTYIDGSPTEHNTTTQEICYRCYPTSTTNPLTTTMKYTHHTRTYDNDVTTQDENSRKTTNKMDFKTLALITTGTAVVLLILVILVVVYVIIRRLRKRRKTPTDDDDNSSNPSTWEFSADSGRSTVASGASTYLHPYNEIDESQMLPDSTYVDTIPLRGMDPEAIRN